MMGLVPFDFKNRQTAYTAAATFRSGSVWEVTTPAFDSKAKPEYNGCPMKAVLLLKSPTRLKEITSESEEAYKLPACGLKVALDIRGIMQALQRAGSATRSSKTFDFCGKLVALTDQKIVTKNNVDLKVSEATFLDGGGGRVSVSVWQGAHLSLARAQVGDGIAVVGCTATVENGEVKLSIWPTAHVCTEGAQAAQLKSMDASAVDAQTLTATFSPGANLAELVAEGALPTCAVALAEAVAKGAPVAFQINRCMLEPPLEEELIFAQSGRPFIKNCRLRDRTGGVDVDVVNTAVPFLFGCDTEVELKEHVRAQSLTSVRQRMNVRGVVREEGGVTRRYVATAELAPLEAVVSVGAMRLSTGLSTISGDVVSPGPASRLHDAPMIGMALARDQGEPLGAHRVLLLVRGTQGTDCESIDESLPMAEQVFKISSKNVQCLLSEAAVALTLVGYSNFKGMLAYRLDKEVALVLVSAVDGKPGMAGSAAAGSTAGSVDGKPGMADSAAAGSTAGSATGVAAEGMVATVEHMQKVSLDEARRLMVSMNAEWKSVLTVADAGAYPSPLSAKGEPYWSEQRTPKLRRLQSEPTSPPPRKLDFGS